MGGSHQGQAILWLFGLGAGGPGGDESQGWGGGRGDPEAPGISQRKPGAGKVQSTAAEGVPHRKWRDRISQFISHVRLKRSGAWWYVEQANPPEAGWRCGVPSLS
jgi:hypothetical protein